MNPGSGVVPAMFLGTFPGEIPCRAMVMRPMSGVTAPLVKSIAGPRYFIGPDVCPDGITKKRSRGRFLHSGKHFEIVSVGVWQTRVKPAIHGIAINDNRKWFQSGSHPRNGTYLSRLGTAP